MNPENRWASYISLKGARTEWHFLNAWVNRAMGGAANGGVQTAPGYWEFLMSKHESDKAKAKPISLAASDLTEEVERMDCVTSDSKHFKWGSKGLSILFRFVYMNQCSYIEQLFQTTIELRETRGSFSRQCPLPGRSWPAFVEVVSGHSGWDHGYVLGNLDPTLFHMTKMPVSQKLTRLCPVGESFITVHARDLPKLIIHYICLI